MRKALIAVLVAGACVAGVLCAIGWQWQDRSDRFERERQRAQQELPAIARHYADQVVGASRDRGGPDDARLYALTTTPDAAGAWVWVLARTPDLTLLVQTRSSFPTMFGAGEANACFRLAFHDLGSAAAGYDFETGQCPAGALPAAARRHDRFQAVRRRPVTVHHWMLWPS
ncbi:hypothetical protein [Dactylosporangium sp. CA-233914]|uniref:hypothetical protein n=1 Tax=Dactylosporangium sp. CA-233914 TaxID=3239934 RepID=UPI003D9057A5